MYKFTFCILNCSSCWTQLKVLKLATRIKHSVAALHTILSFAIWRRKPMQTQHKMQIASTTYSRRRRCIWEWSRHTTFCSLSLSFYLISRLHRLSGIAMFYGALARYPFFPTEFLIVLFPSFLSIGVHKMHFISYLNFPVCINILAYFSIEWCSFGHRLPTPPNILTTSKTSKMMFSLMNLT